MTKKFSDFTVPVSPIPAYLAGYLGLNNLQIPVGVANGIPYIDSAGNVQPTLGSIPGLSYATPPTLLGQLYVYVGDLTVDLAKADSLVTCQAVAGAYDGVAVLSVVEGVPYSIRFESGLTLTGGDQFYVSATTAGLVTNVEPVGSGTFSRVCGVVVDASAYNSLDLSGSVALCTISPQLIVANP